VVQDNRWDGGFLNSLSHVAQESPISQQLSWPRTATAKTNEIAPLASPQPPEVTPPPPPQIVSPQEQPKAEQGPRPLTPDPFTFKTVNAGGGKVHFQHSRQAGEFQIRFGDCGRQDMPADAVREFIKSHKTEVATRDGEKKEVQLFHWNPDDRAWGMRIDHQDPETSRKVAKRIFDEVVRRVAEERKSQQSPSL
jgi:hypothetical protein